MILLRRRSVGFPEVPEKFCARHAELFGDGVEVVNLKRGCDEIFRGFQLRVRLDERIRVSAQKNALQERFNQREYIAGLSGQKGTGLLRIAQNPCHGVAVRMHNVHFPDRLIPVDVNMEVECEPETAPASVHGKKTSKVFLFHGDA